MDMYTYTVKNNLILYSSWYTSLANLLAAIPKYHHVVESQLNPDKNSLTGIDIMTTKVVLF